MASEEEETTGRVWVLGPSDPEMAAIEAVLRGAGERVVYALGPDWQRVRPERAYRATCESAELDHLRAHGGTVYAVECELLDDRYGTRSPEYTDCAAVVVRIDHHCPGDPGYGRPPAEYAAASSLGQVLAELAHLGVAATPPEDWRLVAAADHCLAAAYRGECPGVDPDALMRWRAASRAAHQRRPIEAILADIEHARAALREAPLLVLHAYAMPGGHCGGRSCGCREGGYEYGGSTRGGTGDCYCDCNGCRAGDGLRVVVARDMRGRRVPELPEASAREGLCFVADGLPLPDGRRKVVCQSGSPEQIRAFMLVWGPAVGLRDIYGDPQRGFAGGYWRNG